MRATLAIIVTFMSLAGTQAKDLKHPNVLIILADDQGWGDLSMNGNTNLKTPNMDSLAKDGAMFRNFFVCPVCSPTRAEFMTGRYHPRGGVRGVSTGGERLDLDEKTIADYFKDAGYRTGCFGKWHNGSQYPYHPNGRGFDEYYGFTSGHWGDYFSPPLDHNGELVTGKGFLTDDLTNHAIDFMKQKSEQPFFCYVPLNIPHSPMQVPDSYWNRFAKKKLELTADNQGKEDIDHTRAALAMCENIDDNIGRMLKYLDDNHLAENTIVMYFSDNGPNGWRWNDGLRGRKGSTDEGGVKSALLIRSPKQIQPGTQIDRIAGAIDLLPTLAELCQVPLNGKKPLDGKSLSPLFQQQKGEWPDRQIFSHWAGRVSVRTQQYRLDHTGKLYDMIADPAQKTDISKKASDTAKTLQDAVANWKQELLEEFKTPDNRPLTVGHTAKALTYLPARDGVPHGKIKRSAGAPNCSFFTNWKSTADFITWDVEVLNAGTFEVEIRYTAPESSIGTEIEFSLGDTKLTQAIPKSFESELRGAENDRVTRQGESYVKEFATWKIGTVSLPKGRAELKLQATKIPNTTVMDVHSVHLRRVKQ